MRYYPVIRATFALALIGMLHGCSGSTQSPSTGQTQSLGTPTPSFSMSADGTLVNSATVDAGGVVSMDLEVE